MPSRRTSTENLEATSSSIQLAQDADLLIRTYLPSIRSSSTEHHEPHSNSHSEAETPDHPSHSLPKPFCLPQLPTNPNFFSAFTRGYNASLSDFGITQEMLLNFIDGLNLAIVASPPLRVVNLVGEVLGFVPYHWAMIAAVIIKVTAQTTMRILSKTLTDRYLRFANLNLFKPHGLSVRLCTTRAMFRLLSSSNANASPKAAKAKLNKFGRGVGKAILSIPSIPMIPGLPQVKHIVRSVADNPPKISATELTSESSSDTDNDNVPPVLLRRLALTEGLALSVSTQGLPPPAKPRGVMDRISAWGVKFDGKIDARSERSTENCRRALERFEVASGMGSYQDADAVSSSLSARSPTANSKRLGSGSAVDKFELRIEAAERSMRDVERLVLRKVTRTQGMRVDGGGASLLSLILWPLPGPGMTRMEEKVANADLMEHWTKDNVLWVVIMSADKDADIDGIEMAEDPANEERVSREDWRMEMEVEREEMMGDEGIVQVEPEISEVKVRSDVETGK